MIKTKSKKIKKDPIKAAEEYGIDIPMLMANLNRSVAERFRRHQIALETYYKIRNSKKV